jgi:hypothetical protein
MQNFCTKKGAQIFFGGIDQSNTKKIKAKLDIQFREVRVMLKFNDNL